MEASFLQHKILLDSPVGAASTFQGPARAEGGDFSAVLRSVAMVDPPTQKETAAPKTLSGPLPSFHVPIIDDPLPRHAGSLKDQLEKYKEDQLLSNPGGDYYFLNRPQGPYEPDYPHQDFFHRIWKDIKDAVDNGINFFKNLFFGAQYRYVDADGTVKTAQKRGLLGTIVEFFKDLGSALTLGAWRPDGEPEPKGLLDRFSFAFDKFGEAVFGDLVLGIPGSIIDLSEDLALFGWNLIEVIPDATIGNFEEGRRVTTTIFDNGQVVIDYLTDILPTGEAWLRVHAMEVGKDAVKLPVIFNLRTPEQGLKDMRWATVRNTPFRKLIETIGSLIADVLAVKFTGQSIKTSRKRNP